MRRAEMREGEKTHECWMCGYEHEGEVWFFQLGTRVDDPRFGVSVCWECAQLVRMTAERVRTISRQHRREVVAASPPVWERTDD